MKQKKVIAIFLIIAALFLLMAIGLPKLLSKSKIKQTAFPQGKISIEREEWIDGKTEAIEISTNDEKFTNYSIYNLDFQNIKIGEDLSKLFKKHVGNLIEQSEQTKIFDIKKETKDGKLEFDYFLINNKGALSTLTKKEKQSKINKSPLFTYGVKAFEDTEIIKSFSAKKLARISKSSKGLVITNLKSSLIVVFFDKNNKPLPVAKELVFVSAENTNSSANQESSQQINKILSLSSSTDTNFSNSYSNSQNSSSSRSSQPSTIASNPNTAIVPISIVTSSSSSYSTYSTDSVISSSMSLSSSAPVQDEPIIYVTIPSTEVSDLPSPIPTYDPYVTTAKKTPTPTSTPSLGCGERGEYAIEISEKIDEYLGEHCPKDEDDRRTIMRDIVAKCAKLLEDKAVSLDRNYIGKCDTKQCLESRGLREQIPSEPGKGLCVNQSPRGDGAFGPPVPVTNLKKTAAPDWSLRIKYDYEGKEEPPPATTCFEAFCRADPATKALVYWMCTDC